MRVLLVLFGLGATASAAVALREVSHEATHREEVTRPQTTTRPDPDVVHAPRAELTFPRGPLPFGGVPGRPSDAPPTVAITGENNDSEGIVDVLDRCPDEPEDINGFADNDGCPDRVITIDIPPTVEVYLDGQRTNRYDTIIY